MEAKGKDWQRKGKLKNRRGTQVVISEETKELLDTLENAKNELVAVYLLSDCSTRRTTSIAGLALHLLHVLPCLFFDSQPRRLRNTETNIEVKCKAQMCTA